MQPGGRAIGRCRCGDDSNSASADGNDGAVQDRHNSNGDGDVNDDDVATVITTSNIQAAATTAVTATGRRRRRRANGAVDGFGADAHDDDIVGRIEKLPPPPPRLSSPVRTCLKREGAGVGDAGRKNSIVSGCHSGTGVGMPSTRGVQREKVDQNYFSSYYAAHIIIISHSSLLLFFLTRSSISKGK